MEKTPVLPPIINTIAVINDQMMFFLFSEKEFLRRLSDFGPAASALYTTDVFSGNPYAKRLNVTLQKLPMIQRNNRSTTFGSYFSTAYEIASDYFELATILLKRCNGTTFRKVSKDSQGKALPIETAFIETLRASNSNLPDQEFINTMTYFRFRRNHFIHRSTQISPTFSTFILNEGSNLNKFWLFKTNQVKTPPQAVGLSHRAHRTSF